MGRVADGEHPPAGAHQAGGVAPAPQRLLGRAEVGPAEQQPGVEQYDGGVPAIGDRLGPRGRDHDRGVVAHVGEHAVTR